MDASNNPDATNDESEQNNHTHKSLNDEKLKVRKQIEELKKLIPEIELQLEIITYGEYEIVGKPSFDTHSKSSTSMRQNIKDILQYELFKMSGIYCSKFTEDECVFNFSSSSNFHSRYAVQIFTEDGSVRLGAWVMPWGITIDRIESETPLQSSKDVIPFLKNCKRIIDCHADREEQFQKLKECTSSIKNLNVDATLGYLTILCNFLDVYDNSADRRFNLTINMYYGAGRVRPSTINVEWNLKEKLSENILVKVKTFAKSFKTENLVDALENIKAKTHPIYVWKSEEYTDRILDVTDINFSSGSDSQMEISGDQETEHPRRRRKSRRIRKRGRKPLSSEEVDDKNPNQTASNTANSGEHENDDLERSKDISDPKLQPEQRVKPILQPTKSKQQTKRIPRAKNDKSKQTELSFKGVPINSESVGSNRNMRKRMDLIKEATTSTPMTLRSVTHKHQTSIQSLEISPINKIDRRKTAAGMAPNQSTLRQPKKKKKMNE